MRPAILALATLTLFTLLTIAGCNRSPEPTAQPPLKIGIETWAGYAFAYLAEDRGLFEKHGVDVELVFAQDSATSRDRFARGEIMGWFDVLPEAVTGYARGVPARVVWVVDYSDSADVLIGDAAIDSIEDLGGKRIGIEGINTFSHMFALELLAKHGIPEEAVQFVIVNPMEILAALEADRIDAGHTWEPVKTEATAKGYKIFGKAGEIPGLITDVLFMSPEAIATRPNEIQGVVAAFAEAIELWRDQPEDSLRIMAESEKMTVDQLRADLAGLHILDLPDNRRAMSQDDPDSVYVRLHDIIEFFVSRGQIVARPAVDQLVDPRFIRAMPDEP